jgi:uncharacterized protein (TIGR00266 family)
MEHRIIGTTMPVLEVTLQPGESLVAEAGELSWMSSTIQLQTSTKTGAPSGMFGRIKRVIGGGGLFMTEYSAQGGPGIIAFATKMPGQIFPVQVQAGRGYRVHRSGFLCATPGIEVSVAFQQSLGAGVFGGEGFVLQKLEGDATAFVELDGEVVVYELGPSDTLRVHPGHVGLFEESVSFNLTTVPGIKNKIFGGDGLFLAALTGPGKVWLQSLPLSNLAQALAPYLPETQAAATGGLAGGALGNLLRQ